MSAFKFEGVIPASKSHFNRALICASYGSAVTLLGESRCDDVLKMKEAFAGLSQQSGHRSGSGQSKESVFDCGAAGTVLRFLALRVSRIPGKHILKGHPRLMSRPQEDLRKILEQLNVKMELHEDHMVIQGDGWQPKNPILKVNREISSQFISGLVLNAWELNFPLEIHWDQTGVSEGYWQMSLQVVQDFGMKVDELPNGIRIGKNEKVKIKEYRVESDVSSAFAIAAYAALNGEAVFHEFPYQTLQPDVVFVDILEKMGAGIERKKTSVRIFKKLGEPLKGVHWNLNECPDLFPVLATLCGFAQTDSRLDGAPHLVFKESNRIQKTAELLGKINIQTKVLSDGMEVFPSKGSAQAKAPFSYDPDHDHRLAFAAALVKSQNFPLELLHPEVVNKSFPEFWDILNLKVGKSSESC